ncbi:MAG: glycosyltransferase family 2 protein [Brevinemataceae bacterium]
MNIAIIIPCYNEDITITKVVRDFQKTIPNASVYVFDNNSSDNTYQFAIDAGAIVHRSPYQGKGNVIRHAFSIIDADYYIIADGDDQCDVSIISEALQKMKVDNLDMLSLVRVADKANYRIGHAFGNKALTFLVNLFFRTKCSDVLGGYRIFSKAFVKSFPAHAKGFEIEVELSIFAHQLRLLTNEMNVPYRTRPEGSFSKLHTIRDGVLILKTILGLISNEKPLLFFSTIGLVFGVLGGFLAIDVYLEFLRISAVPRFPTFILSMSLLFLSALSLAIGVILSCIHQNTLEARRFVYTKFKHM